MGPGEGFRFGAGTMFQRRSQLLSAAAGYDAAHVGQEAQVDQD